MKHMKKILILILAFMLCFASVSCNSNDKNDENDDTPKKTFEEFQCKVSYGNFLEDTVIHENALNATEGNYPIYRLDTKQELTQFLIDYDEYIPYDDCDYEDTFIAATKPYDESFFEENSLLVVYVQTSSGSYSFGVDKVDINGERCVVDVKQTNAPEIITHDMAAWFISVTVKKSTIKDCTSFDAIRVSNKQAQ